MRRDKGTRLKRHRPSLTELRFAHDRGARITLHFLASLLLCLSLARVTSGFPQKAGTSDAPVATSSIAGTVSVVTGQGEVNNLAGVTVKLAGPIAGSTLQSTLTDGRGHFTFSQLVAGTYTLEVSAEGFRAWSKTIAVQQNQGIVEDATIEINTVDEKIEVQ